MGTWGPFSILGVGPQWECRNLGSRPPGCLVPSLAKIEKVWACFTLPESSESEPLLQVKLEQGSPLAACSSE